MAKPASIVCLLLIQKNIIDSQRVGFWDDANTKIANWKKYFPYTLNSLIAIAIETNQPHPSTWLQGNNMEWLHKAKKINEIYATL